MKKNLKIKGDSIIVCIIACIVIAIIINVIVSEKMNEDTKVASTEKVETTQKQEEQSTSKTLTEIIAREPNTDNFTYVSSEDGIQVPVPKGYVASPEAEERYVNGIVTDGVREHHGGFVIYEKNAGETDEEATITIENDLDTVQMERNQWVWVPISSSEISNMYHTDANLIYGNYYSFTTNSYSITKTAMREPSVNNQYDYDQTYLKQYLEGISRNEFQQAMREEFAEMLKSVATYGGFYIGRYETGNLRQNNVKIVKGQTGTTSGSNMSSNNINYITWYGAYKKCKNIRATNSVSTGLIWGIQWDETLKWIIDSGEKTYSEISNSTTWGNYTNNTANGHGSLMPTGHSESWKANNIYDLAGNIYEWTIESDGKGRCVRGGWYYKYGNEASASYRWFYPNPHVGDYNVGCRAIMQIALT